MLAFNLKNVMITNRLFVSILIFLLTSSVQISAQTVYNVKTYGAIGNGNVLETTKLQIAIDACYNGGGGQVYFPAGTYKTTCLNLKSNVTIKLDAGAKLQASLTATDWTGGPVLKATSLNNIGVIGTGIIDGGGIVYYVDGSQVSGTKPQGIINFENSTNVPISGIRMQNAVAVTCKIVQCDNVLVDGVIVRNPEFAIARGSDGIDINGGRFVTVQNCDVETGDDAICIKPQGDAWSKPARVTHDITIKNCTVASTTNGVKIGTGTTDEAYNLNFIDIIVNKHSSTPNTGGRNPIASGNCQVALSLQSNDGGNIHEVIARNFTIKNCYMPFWLEVQQRKAGQSFGHLDKITLSDINCSRAEGAANINVQNGARLNDITLNNITIHNFETYSGTMSPFWLDGSYPYGNSISGKGLNLMPAYGLFARCVTGLKLTGINQFFDDGKSGRLATKFEDVTFGDTISLLSKVSRSGFELGQNFPNPFSSSTTIKYNLTENCHVKINIYDLPGRLVNTLVDKDIASTENTVVWNGDNYSGNAVPNGIYFYTMETKSSVLSSRILLMK
jgi:hypothetical protein